MEAQKHTPPGSVHCAATTNRFRNGARWECPRPGPDTGHDAGPRSPPSRNRALRGTHTVSRRRRVPPTSRPVRWTTVAAAAGAGIVSTTAGPTSARTPRRRRGGAAGTCRGRFPRPTPSQIGARSSSPRTMALSRTVGPTTRYPWPRSTSIRRSSPCGRGFVHPVAGHVRCPYADSSAGGIAVTTHLPLSQRTPGGDKGRSAFPPA